MSGFQTSARPRPVMSTGRPPMPVVPRWRVGRAEAVLKAEQFGPAYGPWVRMRDEVFGPPNLFSPSWAGRPGSPPGRTKEGCRIIVSRIAELHGVTVGEILGPRRHKPLVAARKAAMIVVAAHMPHWSLPKIGQFFNRDHTTILYALGRTRRSGAA